MSASTFEAPLTQVIRHHVPAVGTAGNDSEVAIGVANVTGHISSVKYYADAARAGANTDSRTISVINKTGPKTPHSLALVSGVDLAAFVGKALTASSTATDYDVAVGDVLSFKSLHIGNGIVDPGGLLEITITRD